MARLTPHAGNETMVLVGAWGRIWQLWHRMSLSVQFLAAAALVVSIAMVALGGWAGNRIQASATRSAAEAGAMFLQAFLQPYVQEIPISGPLDPELTAKLDNLLAIDPTKPFMMLKIWQLDNRLVYSSNKDILPNEPAEEQIQIAARGGLASNIEELSGEVRDVSPQNNVSLLEVYAPLYRTGTNEIIAVGEFYQSAEGLLSQQQRTRDLTWLVVCAISIFMLGVLFLIVSRGSRTIDSQQRRLQRQFVEANALANQNSRLRRAADRARVDASEANEDFLSRIGSEMHDGPIQTLSLLMLSLQYGRDGDEKESVAPEPEDETGAPSTIRLARSLYGELRDISVGLILPELREASLPDVFRLAVRRHEATTGALVKLTLGDFPDDATHAIRICCYRVVQEALGNGFRHAGGKGQRVSAGVSGRRLRILVVDDGPGFDSAATGNDGRQRLGLIGMRNRVKSLKGKLSVRSRPGAGTRIAVVLPLDQSMN